MQTILYESCFRKTTIHFSDSCLRKTVNIFDGCKEILQNTTGVHALDPRTGEEPRFCYWAPASTHRRVRWTPVCFSCPGFNLAVLLRREKGRWPLKLGGSILLALSIVLTQSVPTARPSDPVYAQLRALKMSGETAPTNGLTIQRDRATFVFKRGDFHFVEPVQGRVVAA